MSKSDIKLQASLNLAVGATGKVTPPNPRALELAAEDDRLWFERNPLRSYRARISRPGEFVDWPGRPHHPDLLRCTIVEQVRTGFRFRAGAYLPRLPDDNDFACCIAFANAGGFGR